MTIRAILFSAVALNSSSALAAQHPAPSAGRVAGIAPAPAPSPATPKQNLVGPAPAVFGVPVLIFNDGRVFADFGWGWEQVVRSCALPVNYGNQVQQNAAPIQPTVVQPTVTQPAVPSQPAPLPYTQPVPNQPTASQQMVAAGNQAVQYAQPVSSQRCWSVNPQGRVFVARP